MITNTATEASSERAPEDNGHVVATSELALGGMHCNACALRIEGALSRTPGVVSAAVNLATTKAFVSYDPNQVAVGDLQEAVAGEGYTAVSVDAGAVAPEVDAGEHWVRRASISWVLSLGALGIALFGSETVIAGWAILALGIAVEIIGGWPFLRAAARQARHASTSMDTLIAIGTLAALSVSAVEVIALGGRHVHIGGGGAFAARLHGVMGPLIVSILATGRAVEEKARDRAAEAMRSLLALRPRLARVVKAVEDDTGDLVPPESVPVGALLRVRAGEIIPLDGTVVGGWSAVDESMLTGEPMPVDRGPGGEVSGGTRNGSGILVVRVTAIAAESVLSRLQRLVDEAQRDKPPLQKIADRVSAIFVPVVLVGSLVTFLVWWQAGDNFGKAVLSGIAVLLVACPCAMGLATPVAMMVGTGRASALGILVRSSEALERLARADYVVFDKTGTLTERAARVNDVLAVPGCTAGEVLALAAAVEAESEHPLAAAIRSRAADPEPDGSPIPERHATEIVEMAGTGVAGKVHGREVTVTALTTSAVPPALEQAVAAATGRGDTVVLVRLAGSVAGAICVSTPLRPEAAAAVTRVRAMGLGTAVLSGDSSPAVGAVARDLGIEDARGGLSAADKVEAIRAIEHDGHRAMMVGDGVNDAPALAAANVGCAIGSGTDAAITSSDVTLLGNDLQGVPASVAMSRSTLAVIHENFGWAMGYNISALPLAAAGLLDPLVAAVAMGLSSIIVVLNSLRLRRLGRGGLASVKPPKLTRGVRGVVMSVALPVALFAGATVIAEAVSPARGQSLLPTLPSVVDVALPAGGIAEVYWDHPGAGVNTFHLFFLSGGVTGGSLSASDVKVRAVHDGASEPVRLVRASPGHYLSYVDMARGLWNYTVTAEVKGHAVSFTVHHDVT